MPKKTEISISHMVIPLVVTEVIYHPLAPERLVLPCPIHYRTVLRIIPSTGVLCSCSVPVFYDFNGPIFKSGIGIAVHGLIEDSRTKYILSWTGCFFYLKTVPKFFFILRSMNFQPLSAAADVTNAGRQAGMINGFWAFYSSLQKLKLSSGFVFLVLIFCIL